MKARDRSVIDRAIQDGATNLEIKNKIAHLEGSPEDRREVLEYLEDVRTSRGEDINIFSGRSNVSDRYRTLKGPKQTRDPGTAVDRESLPVAEVEDASPDSEAIAWANARRAGPKPATNRQDVERTAARLKAAGERFGERSIAEALGVSRGAVRHALGKDRRP